MLLGPILSTPHPHQHTSRRHHYGVAFTVGMLLLSRKTATGGPTRSYSAWPINSLSVCTLGLRAQLIRTAIGDMVEYKNRLLRHISCRPATPNTLATPMHTRRTANKQPELGLTRTPVKDSMAQA